VEHDDIFVNFNTLGTLAYKQGDLKTSNELTMKAMKSVKGNVHKPVSEADYM